MIITDIKQLSEVPVGETAVLVLQFKVVNTYPDDTDPCSSCIFDGLVCCSCFSFDRPDKEDVKFLKI